MGGSLYRCLALSLNVFFRGEKSSDPVVIPCRSQFRQRAAKKTSTGKNAVQLNVRHRLRICSTMKKSYHK